MHCCILMALVPAWGTEKQEGKGQHARGNLKVSRNTHFFKMQKPQCEGMADSHRQLSMLSTHGMLWSVKEGGMENQGWRRGGME